MNIRLTLASLLTAASLWLTGCASAPQLGQANVEGFHADGTTVLVDYVLAKNDDRSAKEHAELHAERVKEIQQMLQRHGFKTVTTADAAFKVRVVESVDHDITGDWAGAVGANVVLFTLGVVPAMFDYRNDFHYELWAGDKKVHQINTEAHWQKAVGLVSISSTLSGEDAAREKARVGAHDSVIRLWIDQGSFE